MKWYGQVPSDKVKDYMEKANIFIGTSNFNEGWGAVINEAMNAGCAIVANQEMGAVPTLIENNENGLMYNSFDELEAGVKRVIQDDILRKKLSKNAYKTITEEWTSEVASENLIKLFSSIVNGEERTAEYGPASKAERYIKI